MKPKNNYFVVQLNLYCYGSKVFNLRRFNRTNQH